MIALAALTLLSPAQITPEIFATKIAAARESDAAVPAALDALAQAAFQPGFRLADYQRAAGTPEFPTDVRSLQVIKARKGDHEVVGLSVGPFSRLVGRDRQGWLTFPKRFDLVKRFEAAPRFVGSALLVDGASIQDMSVRYGYRLAYLAPTARGFELRKDWKGVWTLDEAPNAHLELSGTKMTLRTIEEPKTFFTSNAERLFPTTTVWDLAARTPRLLRTQRDEPELRAVDAWIATAQASKSPTSTQSRFLKRWGRERPMLEGWQVGKGNVTLENGGRYRFRVSRNGLVTFRGVSEP